MHEGNAWDIFISYSIDDSDVAESLKKALGQLGWSAFVAHCDLRAHRGEPEFVHGIDIALDQSSVVLVVISPAAMSSDWVQYEWASTVTEIRSGRGGYVVPLWFKGVGVNDWPRSLRQFNFVDFRQWSDPFNVPAALIKQLKEILGEPTGVPLIEREEAFTRLIPGIPKADEAATRLTQWSHLVDALRREDYPDHEGIILQLVEVGRNSVEVAAAVAAVLIDFATKRGGWYRERITNKRLNDSVSILAVESAFNLANPSPRDIRPPRFRIRIPFNEDNISWSEMFVTNLRGVDLSESDLFDINFSKLDLSWADLSQTKILKLEAWNTVLRHASMADIGFAIANFFNVDAFSADLTRANLQKARFGSVNLQRASLRNADLRGVDLSNTDLRGAILFGVKYDCGTKWPPRLDAEKAGAIKAPDLIYD